MTAEHLMMTTEHHYFARRHEQRRLLCCSREELAAQQEPGQRHPEGLDPRQNVDILTAASQGHLPDARGDHHVWIRGHLPGLRDHRDRHQRGTSKMTRGTPRIGSKRHGRQNSRLRKTADNISGINSSGKHNLGTMPKPMRGRSGSLVAKAEDAENPQCQNPLLPTQTMQPGRMTITRNLQL